MTSMIAAVLLAINLEALPLPEQRPIPAWALDAYGDEVLFEVRRKGKKIGTHKVTFSQSGDTYFVDTETLLKVKFLFITAYKFEYRTRETWQGDKLVSIETQTNNNGKRTEYDIAFDETAATVADMRQEGAQTAFDIGNGLFPSNHWHPFVLETNQVMNTITGKANQVEITPRTWEFIEVSVDEDEPREQRAMRYDYDGELKDVSAWYDPKGRWVGLSFKGDDGSTISYHCIECGV